MNSLCARSCMHIFITDINLTNNKKKASDTNNNTNALNHCGEFISIFVKGAIQNIRKMQIKPPENVVVSNY